MDQAIRPWLVCFTDPPDVSFVSFCRVTDSGQSAFARRIRDIRFFQADTSLYTIDKDSECIQTADDFSSHLRRRVSKS